MWEAEFDATYVKKHRTGVLNYFNILVRDQGDPRVLDSWIDMLRGSFDVVIDDGGNQNCQIWTIFLKLWPMVKSEGIYFSKVTKWREYNEICFIMHSFSDGEELEPTTQHRFALEQMTYLFYEMSSITQHESLISVHWNFCYH